MVDAHHLSSHPSTATFLAIETADLPWVRFHQSRTPVQTCLTFAAQSLMGLTLGNVGLTRIFSSHYACTGLQWG